MENRVRNEMGQEANASGGQVFFPQPADEDLGTALARRAERACAKDGGVLELSVLWSAEPGREEQGEVP